MFYNNIKIYRGKGKTLPEVYDPDTTNNIRDPDIKKIFKTGVKNTPDNNEATFFIDPVAPSYVYIIAYTILGDGLHVSIENNEKADRIVNDFNKNINTLNDSIDDYIIDSIIDNFIHKYSLWRIKRDGDKIDFQRVSPKTITISYDAVNGWRKFIQKQGNGTRYDTYASFLKNDPSKKYRNYQYVSIADDPRVCIYSSFFRQSPISMVSHLIIYKRWILMFMRKYAERMWAPARIGYVGDPKTNYMPTSDEEMQESIDMLNEAMQQLRNFSNITIPGNFRIDSEKPSANGEVYLKYIEMLNEEIMFGLFGSMGVRQTSNSWKSVSIVDESVIRVLYGIRREIESALKKLYVHNLVPDVDPNDIKFYWSPIRSSSISEYTKSIVDFAKIGAFKDMREIRRAASIVFPFISENKITDEEVSKMFDFLVLMNAPSQKDSNTPDILKGGKGDADSESVTEQD